MPGSVGYLAAGFLPYIEFSRFLFCPARPSQMEGTPGQNPRIAY